MNTELKSKLFNEYIETSFPATEKENVLYDLKAMSEAFSKGVEAGESQFKWVSVKERLPEEDFDDGYTFVFVRVKTNIGYLIEVDYIRNGRWELHRTPDKVVTHWMNISVAGLPSEDEETVDEQNFEEVMTFEEMAKKEGGNVEVYEPSKEFLEDFQAYMEESIRESNKNAALAELSAKDVIIF